MTWHRISASCWGGSTVGATCCLMPRCKRDRFRHLSDAMSLKQSKDCICPVCPVFAIILLSFFFRFCKTHEEDLTYTCYQMYVSRTQSPNSTALFPTSFVSLSPLVGACPQANANRPLTRICQFQSGIWEGAKKIDGFVNCSLQKNISS